MESEDHRHLADDLDHETDRLADESDRLGHEIDDVRSDWRAKQNSDSVPGAVKPPEDESESAGAGETAETKAAPPPG